jgi:peptidoglycan hydrolase FlgJ
MELTSGSAGHWNVTQLRPKLPSGDGRAQLEFVAREFESLFAKQMLDSMRATLNNGHDLLNGGMAEEIFNDMLYDEYARMMARTGSLGIADMIVRQYENAVTTGDAPAKRVAALYDSV